MVKTKHVFGKVAVEAEIDKSGKPVSVMVLSGDPELAAAVVSAVNQWRWQPFRINGVPVEVESTITVNFEPR